MWSIAFAFIPKRYLIGAAAIAALLLGSYAAVRLYGSHREAVGYNKGWNHAVVIETQKQVVVVDSLERVAVSIAAQAARHDTLRVTTVPPSLHPRIAPLTAADSALVPTVPLSRLVAVYFASDSVQTPHYADLAVAQLAAFQDSIIYRVLIPQRDSAVVIALAWKRAWGSEHLAREASDSLSSLWRTRALNIAPSASHRTRDVVFASLGIVAGFIAAKRIH